MENNKKNYDSSKAQDSVNEKIEDIVAGIKLHLSMIK